MYQFRRSNFKIFETVSAAKKITTKYKNVVMRSERKLVAKLLVIQSRGISLEDVLMYELSPTPLSFESKFFHITTKICYIGIVYTFKAFN